MENEALETCLEFAKRKATELGMRLDWDKIDPDRPTESFRAFTPTPPRPGTLFVFRSTGCPLGLSLGVVDDRGDAHYLRSDGTPASHTLESLMKVADLILCTQLFAANALP